MQDLKLQTIILAAGLGKRMRSELPKVCHKLGGRPLLHAVLDVASKLNPEQMTAVVSPNMPEVTQVVEAFSNASQTNVNICFQQEQLGTGHALIAAREHWQGFSGPILVLFGDTPLLSLATLEMMVQAHRGVGTPAIVTLGMQCTHPNRYGRIELDANGEVISIIEYKDATPAQRNNPLCNSGVMLIDGVKLPGLIDKLECHNAQQEYYLTDLVHLARSQGDVVVCVEGSQAELLGVNTRLDLAQAEAALQSRWREKAMLEGATLMDPKTVYFSFDTNLGQDVTIFPNVSFGPGVTVADQVIIRPFCHLEQTDIQEGATVGPFAHLRPGSEIGPQSRIGNFVEIKQSKIGKGAKVKHLSYIGDTDVGEDANVGAGTITCNYDGFAKHRTKIGRQAFIGSNTCLVAPVEVGDNAIVGAGSVITRTIPQEALAHSRVPQQNLEEGAVKYRRKKGTFGQ